MSQQRQADLLSAEIREILFLVSNVGDLYSLVEEPLVKVRRGLAPTLHDRPWPLLPLMVCEAICGRYEHALPAAAALQLLMAAGDVFDDVEDADSAESLSARCGSAVATNVATMLLILAERAILRLRQRRVANETIVRVSETINSFYTTACAGQHLDLCWGFNTAVSEEDYIKVADMKSASQIECACFVGALLADANQVLTGIMASFGKHLGMAAQITNDIQGVTKGSDITKHKLTLPMVYGLAQAEGTDLKRLESVFANCTEKQAESVQIKDLLFRTGAVHYAMVKLDSYKQQAVDCLIAAERSGVNIVQLRYFIE